MTDDSPTTDSRTPSDISPVEADHRTDLPVPAPEPDELAARAPVSNESPAFSEFDIKPEIVQALASPASRSPGSAFWRCSPSRSPAPASGGC